MRDNFSDEARRMVSLCCGERRNSAADQAILKRATGETDVILTRIVTDRAKYYPPVLRAVLPGAEHRRAGYLTSGLERDYGDVKQRLTLIRSFKSLGSADAFCQGVCPRPKPLEWLLGLRVQTSP